MAGCITCQSGGVLPTISTFPSINIPQCQGLIPPYPQQEKLQYSMLDWNINPRTGQSMSIIEGPYGSIAANVFFSIPKDFYFMNSSYYCCTSSAQSNYVEAMCSIEQRLAAEQARFNCCWNSGRRFR